MKKLSMLYLMLFTICLVAVPASAGIDPNEMLLNWSFEDPDPGDGNLPELWWRWPSQMNVTYMVEDVNAFDGNDFVEIYYPSGFWGFSQSVNDVNSGGTIDLIEGTSYTVSVYAKTPDGAADTQFCFKLEFYNDIGGSYPPDAQVVAPQNFTVDGTWRNYDYNFVSPSHIGEIAKVYVSYFMAQDNPMPTGRTVWFDAAALLPGGPLTPCERAKADAALANDYFPPLPGDFDVDCDVDGIDIQAIIDDWLECNAVDNDCS